MRNFLPLGTWHLTCANCYHQLNLKFELSKLIHAMILHMTIPMREQSSLWLNIHYGILKGIENIKKVFEEYQKNTIRLLTICNYYNCFISQFEICKDILFLYKIGFTGKSPTRQLANGKSPKATHQNSIFYQLLFTWYYFSFLFMQILQKFFFWCSIFYLPHVNPSTISYCLHHVLHCLYQQLLQLILLVLPLDF